MLNLRRLTAIITQLALVAAFTFSTVAAKSNGRDAITQDDLKEWLTYLASDELEGRNTYTEDESRYSGSRAITIPPSPSKRAARLARSRIKKA